MGDFNIISDTSATLASVLTDGLSTLAPAPPPIAEISDLQGIIATNPARVTLFLTEIIEDPSARNRPPVRRDTPPTLAISKPPMALLLRYLLTPWSGDRLTDHRILGRVLQVLYDGAILSGSQLVGGLAGGDDALKVTLAPLTLEDRTRIFQAVQKPYHLSVSYEVRVVAVDSEREQSRRPVASRTLVPSTAGTSP